MGFKASKERNFLDASDYVQVAASQTTKQISIGTNSAGDYLDRLIIVAASTAAPGTVNLLDGTTSVFTFGFVPAGMSRLVETVDVGLVATSSKGFNITTGTSVSVVAIGRFTNGGIKE